MTSPRSRRTLLRTGALAVAGLAGCVGGTDDAPESTTAGTRVSTTRTATTDTETAEPTATPVPPLAVEAVRVRSSFLYLTSPDAAGVAAPEGTQFVFADLRETASDAVTPERDALALVADDRRFDATFAPGPAGSSYEVFSRGRAYDPDERDAGWVAFEVPDPLDADEAALTYGTEGQTHSESFDAEAVEALAEPPAAFELVGADVPESVGRGEPFEVSVTVENAGEGDGVFRAALNETHPMYAPNSVEMSVSAGERNEWTDTFGRHLGGDVEKMAFKLVAPGETRELTVEVVSG